MLVFLLFLVPPISFFQCPSCYCYDLDPPSSLLLRPVHSPFVQRPPLACFTGMFHCPSIQPPPVGMHLIPLTTPNTNTPAPALLPLNPATFCATLDCSPPIQLPLSSEEQQSLDLDFRTLFFFFFSFFFFVLYTKNLDAFTFHRFFFKTFETWLNGGIYPQIYQLISKIKCFLKHVEKRRSSEELYLEALYLGTLRNASWLKKAPS